MEHLEAVYRQHAPAVFRYAWGLCGDRHLAEDLVSETFVRLVTRAPRLETKTALAYLLAIARNAYLNGQRRRRREVPLSEAIAVADRDLAESTEQHSRLAALLAGLRSLPEGERSALLLRADHELSYEEIAAVLGISIGAARVRVHRARMRLLDRADWKENGRDARSHT